jgi:hypothetical protein
MATTYERIASVRPANTDEAALYLVPAATKIVGVLRICNQDTGARTYQVSHCAATGAAAGDEFLIYDRSIAGSDTHEISISANATEEIRIKASVADLISFHLSGMKIT